MPTPRKKPFHRVTAAIVRHSGRILLARRPPGGHLAGRWEFPGGKIEEGESPEACLARELGEEFGVGCAVGEFVAASRFAYDDFDIELLAYEVELRSEQLAPSAHDQIRWVPPGELTSFDLAPADVPIAEAIASSAAQPAAARKRS